MPAGVVCAVVVGVVAELIGIVDGYGVGASGGNIFNILTELRLEKLIAVSCSHRFLRNGTHLAWRRWNQLITT